MKNGFLSNVAMLLAVAGVTSTGLYPLDTSARERFSGVTNPDQKCFGYYMERSEWPKGNAELDADYNGVTAVVLGIATLGIFNSIYVPYVKVHKNEAIEMAWLISESYKGGGKNLDHLWNQLKEQVPGLTESQLALLIKEGDQSWALCQDGPLNFNDLKKSIIAGKLQSAVSGEKQAALPQANNGSGKTVLASYQTSTESPPPTTPAAASAK